MPAAEPEDRRLAHPADVSSLIFNVLSAITAIEIFLPSSTQFVRPNSGAPLRKPPLERSRIAVTRTVPQAPILNTSSARPGSATGAQARNNRESFQHKAFARRSRLFFSSKISSLEENSHLVRAPASATTCPPVKGMSQKAAQSAIMRRRFSNRSPRR